MFHQNKDVKREEIIPELIGEENLDYDSLVLFVGKFADFKGIDALLDAAKMYEIRAKAENKKIETIIVGSGALEDKLKEQAKELGLKHTHFVGRKNHSEICKLQNLADVSLIPSRNEPFGLVVIEGTSCGHVVNKLDKMPAIYSMIGSKEEKSKFVSDKAEELGINGETLGTYFDGYMRTVTGLSSAVIDICDDKLQFNNDEIADYTQRTYSQEVIRDKILGIFDEAQSDFNKTRDDF